MAILSRKPAVNAVQTLRGPELEAPPPPGSRKPKAPKKPKEPKKSKPPKQPKPPREPSSFSVVDLFIRHPQVRGAFESYLKNSVPHLARPIAERATTAKGLPILDYANNPSWLHRILYKVVGKKSVVYSILLIGVTVWHTLLARLHLRMIVGSKQFNKDRRHILYSQEPLEPLPVCEEFVPWANIHSARLARGWAWAMGATVLFGGTEKDPDEGYVVHVFYNHSAYFANFLYSFIDPRMAMMAQADLFHDNPMARKWGFTQPLDCKGHPIVARGSKQRQRNLMFFKRSMEGMKHHDVRPGVLPQASDLPFVESDDGKQRAAAYFSNAPKNGKSWIYHLPEGATNLAVKVAKDTGKQVTVLEHAFDGAEFIQPSESNVFPFPAPIHAGRTMGDDIVEAIRVIPEDIEDKRHFRVMAQGVDQVYAKADEATKALGKLIDFTARKAFKVDTEIPDQMADWGSKHGLDREDALARSVDKCRRDDRFMMITHKIYGVHSQEERKAYVGRLLDLTMSDVINEGQLQKLLDDVAYHVRMHQYDRVPRGLFGWRHRFIKKAKPLQK